MVAGSEMIMRAEVNWCSAARHAVWRPASSGCGDQRSRRTAAGHEPSRNGSTAVALRRGRSAGQSRGPKCKDRHNLGANTAAEDQRRRFDGCARARGVEDDFGGQAARPGLGLNQRDTNLRAGILKPALIRRTGRIRYENFAADCERDREHQQQARPDRPSGEVEQRRQASSSYRFSTLRATNHCRGNALSFFN